MRHGDDAGETYYATSDRCDDELVGEFVVVSDTEDEDRPVGVAVALGTLANSVASVPLYYLVLAGRELPGTWVLRGRSLSRGVTPPKGGKPNGYRDIRRMIAASSAL